MAIAIRMAMDEHDNHELDERETFLLVPAGPEVLQHSGIPHLQASGFEQRPLCRPDGTQTRAIRQDPLAIAGLATLATSPRS
jgi:hypothetical protein